MPFADHWRRRADTALAAGFDTVSVDLIFGLPGQTPEAWRRDLATAVETVDQGLLTVVAMAFMIASKGSAVVMSTPASL